MQLYSLAREGVRLVVYEREREKECVRVCIRLTMFMLACGCVCVSEREKERDDVMFLKQSGSIGSQMFVRSFSSSEVCPIF